VTERRFRLRERGHLIMENMTDMQKRTRRILNALSVMGIIATVILCICGYRIGIFTTNEALGGFLSTVGIFAPLLFVLIQMVQVVIPIIPGGMGCLAGVLIFGPLWGFVYNYIGIVMGSILNFLLARRYGKPFVRSIVPVKAYQKYVGWLDRESALDKWFALAIFLPVAPDDYLCLLAGMSQMRVGKFVTIIVLGKPCSIFAYSAILTALSGGIVSVLG
jgi:uncharacterized membrane protein YdjX (TVP38/TMEM64 family)